MLAKSYFPAENKSKVKISIKLNRINLGALSIYASVIILTIVLVWLLTSLSDLSDSAIATYVVGFAAIILGLWQFRRTFVQRNKIKVFHELSEDISSAKEMLDSVKQQYTQLVQILAQAADKAAVESPDNLDDSQVNAKLEEIKEVFSGHEKHIESIFGSYKNVLKVIRKIEKSTVLKERSRIAARYLFYAATDQHKLINKANSVLQSFNVTPPLGQKPNISPGTFIAFRELDDFINEQNSVVSNYLDDLEVIIHNDLVKNVFGAAKQMSQPDEHLTSSGLINNRVDKSLL